MITTLLSDFSRVILLPKDQTYQGGLNRLYADLSLKGSFNFQNFFDFNWPLLHFFETLVGKYDLCIFTTGRVQDDPVSRAIIDPIFKKIYSVEDIGLTKQGPEGYRFVASDLGKKPSEILYIDDQQGNVLAARMAGLTAIHFQSNEQTLAAISSALAL